MSKGRGKYNIFRLIFSRKTFSMLILLIQLGFIAIGFTKLRENMVYLYSLCSFISIILAIFEINRDENPEFKLTWVLLIGLVPVFGAILYLYVHSDFISRIKKNRCDDHSGFIYVYIHVHCRAPVHAPDP